MVLAKNVLSLRSVRQIGIPCIKNFSAGRFLRSGRGYLPQALTPP
jgi:hypothetical protein